MNMGFRVPMIAAAFACNAYAATSNLVVYDDYDENNFMHGAVACSNSYTYDSETAVVHSGTYAISIARIDNAGVGWYAPTVYSTTTDYDGITLWLNAGLTPTSTTSLVIYDDQSVGHYLHLEDIYGGSLPANTWVNLQVSFSSPYFTLASSSPPATVQILCIVNHSGGGPDSIYLDDVSLTGAQVFTNGFEN